VTDAPRTNILKGHIFERVLLYLFQTTYGDRVTYQPEFTLSPITLEVRYPDFHVPDVLLGDAKLGRAGQDIIDTVRKYSRLLRAKSLKQEALKIYVYHTDLIDDINGIFATAGLSDLFAFVPFDASSDTTADPLITEAVALLGNPAASYDDLSAMHDRLKDNSKEKAITRIPSIMEEHKWQPHLVDYGMVREPGEIIEHLETMEGAHEPYWEWSYHMRTVTMLSYLLHASDTINLSDRAKAIIHAMYPGITGKHWERITLYYKMLHALCDDRIDDDENRESLVFGEMDKEEKRMWAWDKLSLQRFDLSDFDRRIGNKIGGLKQALKARNIPVPAVNDHVERETEIPPEREPVQTRRGQTIHNDVLDEEVVKVLSFISSATGDDDPYALLDHVEAMLVQRNAMLVDRFNAFDGGIRGRLFAAVWHYFTDVSRYVKYPEFEEFKTSSYSELSHEKLYHVIQSRGNRVILKATKERPASISGFELAEKYKQVMRLLGVEVGDQVEVHVPVGATAGMPIEMFSENVSFGDICLFEEHHPVFRGLDVQLGDAFAHMATKIHPKGKEMLTEVEADRALVAMRKSHRGELHALRDRLKRALSKDERTGKNIPKIYFVPSDDDEVDLWEVDGKFAAAHFSKKNNSIYLNLDFIRFIDEVNVVAVAHSDDDGAESDDDLYAVGIDDRWKAIFELALHEALHIEGRAEHDHNGWPPEAGGLLQAAYDMARDISRGKLEDKDADRPVRATGDKPIETPGEIVMNGSSQRKAVEDFSGKNSLSQAKAKAKLESDKPIYMRIPLEMLTHLERQLGDAAPIQNLFKVLQEKGNVRYVLYSPIGADIVQLPMYLHFGIKRGIVQEHTRSNTVTLYAAEKGTQISKRFDFNRKLGISPLDSIIVPVGVGHEGTDDAGLIRSCLLGMQMVRIARLKDAGKDHAWLVNDALEQLRVLCGATTTARFDMNDRDIESLAFGNINRYIDAVNKLILMLPINPIDPEELRLLYDHAVDIITAA